MQTLLTHAADLLLMTASLGAAAYCMVLSRRLSRLGSFDKGIGGAIAVLSAQVDDMKSALGEAKAGAGGAERQLHDLVREAQEISAELEMMIAACHDLGDPASDRKDDAPPRGQDDEGENPAAVTSPIENDAAVPIFGSRRGAADAERAEAVPLFRHRAARG